MVQLADLFSVPEMGLLCNVTEYFLQNHIDYHPEILFRDVKVIITKSSDFYKYNIKYNNLFNLTEFCTKLSSNYASIGRQ